MFSVPRNLSHFEALACYADNQADKRQIGIPRNSKK